MSRYLKKILPLRQLTGMNQESLAAMLGTSRSSIAMAESEGRALPDDVSLYHLSIQVAMQQAADQPQEPITIPATARQKWKKELLLIASLRRYEAERLKRSIDKREEQAIQQNNRCKLAACVEQAQAQLTNQFKGAAWQPVNDYHKAWLEREKQYNSQPFFDERKWLQQQRDLLRHTLLLQEAAEAERLATEIE